MTDIALLIADMVKQGVSAEIVGRVAAALAEREPVVVKDQNAERRRAADRERKRNVRGNPQNSPDGSNGSPPPDGPPLPPAPPSPPLNPPTTPEISGGARGEIIEMPNRRAHRLPADFQLTPADLTHARKEGLTDEQIRREFDRFRDHWLAASGANAAKRDWHAAWRNWVRTAIDRLGRSGGPSAGGNRQEASGYLGAYQRVAARYQDKDALPD